MFTLAFDAAKRGPTVFIAVANGQIGEFALIYCFEITTAIGVNIKRFLIKILTTDSTKLDK